MLFHLMVEHSFLNSMRVKDYGFGKKVNRSEQQPLKNSKMRSILQDVFKNQPGY
jgi:hypothetical protein